MAAVLEERNSSSREELTSLERLGLRVSAMINSPLAQLGRRVLIHRLDTDCDQDWDAIMEILSETEGLDMTFCDDGSVILQWEKSADDERMIEREGDEDSMGQEEEVPF
ncbi:DUF1654 domain-containing protein [Pseudomonas sp. S 311-6]|uniref:DUF1654 domain-containing protein n=1 Tax=Pseudomonas TaxID=286 RepID=UPI002097F848|nr:MULTISPECIES: DUF1654 domain-containing protein [Pseudomonas]MCO7566411.1 DUF1654 domain-containing protein [Pseudomonas mosselii]MCO7617439.1 DUF1654 domain-containing protein [Pseudomonas guariconensis]MCO7640717.1 DUF1654 domain-containing protein [Pseudomonas sp. S 311-6]